MKLGCNLKTKKGYKYKFRFNPRIKKVFQCENRNKILIYLDNKQKNNLNQLKNLKKVDRQLNKIIEHLEDKII